MMHFNKMKRWGAVILAGTMAFSLVGCGSKKGDSQADEPAETTTEAAADSSEADDDSEEFVDGSVDLPSDFGDMIYPLTSLMVEASAKGLPYYNEDSTEDEADSFWFSMAVLTSLMNDYVKDVTVDTDENYLYLEEETVNMYASALYDAYAKGNLEFPELPEDDTYAVYNDEDGTYGFLSGGIGTMKAYITDCEEDGEDYILTAELRDTDNDDLYGRYEITITPTSYDGDEDNAFVYGVSAFEEQDSDEEEGVDFSEGATEEEGDTAEESSTEESDETTEEEESSADDEPEISEDEALSLAEEYYGEDAEYTFEDIITVGDYEYYNFAVDGEGVSSTNVLVSVDGENVLGGVQNDDGSWSFDQ